MEERKNFILLYEGIDEFSIMENATAEEVKKECNRKESYGNYDRKGVTAYPLAEPIYKLDEEGKVLIDNFNLSAKSPNYFQIVAEGVDRAFKIYASEVDSLPYGIRKKFKALNEYPKTQLLLTPIYELFTNKFPFASELVKYLHSDFQYFTEKEMIEFFTEG